MDVAIIISTTESVVHLFLYYIFFHLVLFDLYLARTITFNIALLQNSMQLIAIYGFRILKKNNP